MVNNRRILITAILFFGMLVLASRVLAAASIQVELDRDIIEQGESFTINFSSSGDVDDDPDFSPLKKDFRILQQSQSSNIQIINGSMSSKKQWLLMLMPKRTGKLTIPSISFGSDRSAPGFITVNKATAATNGTNRGLLYLEVKATPKQAYVQSQVILTVRIYHAINLVNASLSEVSLSDKKAVLEKLGDDVSYDKTINGRRYKVFEKRFAIFPQASGKLVIDPVQFEGQYVNSRRMLSTKDINSDPVTITVKPKPAVQSAQPGDNWLPAKNLTVMDSWSQNPPQFQVGEPVTRTITMVAEGLLGEQLPPLKKISIPNLKQYPDQPKITNNKDKSGVTGARQEKIAFIATQPGTYHLPAMEIPWWNTERDRQEIAKIDAFDITVAPAAGQANVPPTVPQTAPRQTTPEPAPSTTSGSNENAPATGFTPPAPAQGTSAWFWISMALLLIWLVTIGLWWWQRRRVTANISGDNQQNQKLRTLQRELKQICNRNDAQQAKDKLIQWAQANWREHAPTSLGELGKQCDSELARALASLNQVLYSHATGSWDGPGFWRVFAEHKPAMNQKKQASVTRLEPLFRHSA
jgi:hypothetical protein